MWQLVEVVAPGIGSVLDIVAFIECRLNINQPKAVASIINHSVVCTDA